MRNILLIEPNYKNKYPPIGLMKIATYHRTLGDRVTFFKGDLKEFVSDMLTKKCVDKLNNIDDTINWSSCYDNIQKYLKNGKALDYYEFPSINQISVALGKCHNRAKEKFPIKSIRERTFVRPCLCRNTIYFFTGKQRLKQSTLQKRL